MHSFSRWLALRITAVVSTMACAAVFTALTLVSLPAALKSHDKIIIIGWIAQTFLQLVLLPIIMVGQRLQADATIKHVTKQHNEHMSQITKLHKHLGISNAE